MFSGLIYLKNAMLRVLVCFFLLVLIFFVVPTRFVEVKGITLLIPSQEGETVTDRVMDKIRTDLTPAGVQIVTSNPLDPFTTKAILAVLLSFAISFPYFLFEVFMFVRPGLYPHERKALAWILFFSVILFIAGALFAYTVVIPLIFSSLFTYLPHDVAPLYNIRELVSLVAGLLFAISLVFLLPICMILLTKTGLIPVGFWRTYAKHAILLVVILSAIITPDGSGVSMVLLGVPICLLYGVGYVGSALTSRNAHTNSNH